MAVQLIIQVAGPPLALIGQVAGRVPVSFLLRDHGAPPRALFERAQAVASAVGPGRLCVADRVDVALALSLAGVQLSAASLPAPAVRAHFAGRLGRSVHSVAEGLSEMGSVDYLVFGAIWPTVSHPGRAPVGIDALRHLCERAAVPVWAIGGVGPQRYRHALRAGAEGAVVSSAVWSAPDPAAAADAFFF